MKIWHSSSTETKPCVLCNKKTGTYKVYMQSNISIRIPLCDREDRKCYDKVDVKNMADMALRLISKEAKEGVKK
ncbi:hypothetical protein [Bacillus velezensis]|uniref:hypothetical protein n=1 Tax=Bacillus velezensis TaxID=492670 RepID=UPI0034E5125D